MRSRGFKWLHLFIIFLFLFGIAAVNLSADTGIVTPEKFFGFKPGTDRMLFDYGHLIAYLKKLDAASPRLKMVKIGTSPLGRNMYIAFISSPENIKNLDRLKEINRKLALDPNLPDLEREAMLKEGRVFFLATLSMHSGEVGPAQAAPIIAHQLVTATDEKVTGWLDDVVYMMVPNHNPDGMDMVVNHYKKYKGTKYEGAAMPGVYHKYVGHDNNRDFVTLTQEDTKAISAVYSRDWFPQVMIEKHQMMSDSARYFVPPNHDPIAENLDAGLYNWAGLFGYNMITDMTREGLAGVSQHYLFDNYWPGSTETSIWKNVISMLTEGASANYASPIFIEANELIVRGKGLSEYKKSTNMPLPWPGGWWRLGDLVDYEIVSTMSLIKTSSLHREDLLKFRNDLCKKEVKRGKTQAPYYYILPQEQHDRSELVHMVNLLREHGINIYRLAQDVQVNRRLYEQGDFVVPLSQPYRSFIKEVLEKQVYPVRHYTPDGKVIKPYDIASWSLPLHMGVEAVEINTPIGNFDKHLALVEKDVRMGEVAPANFVAALFPVNNNESFKAAFLALKQGLKVERLSEKTLVEGKEVPKGSFVIYNNSASLNKIVSGLTVSPVYVKKGVKLTGLALKLPRVALVETIFHDMDAGWTRYVFDTYGIPFKAIKPGDFKKTDFAGKFDVVIFPDTNASLLMKGKWEFGGRYYISPYPPKLTKGMDKKGMENLMAFLGGGGIILSWGESCELFLKDLTVPAGKGEMETFQLPATNISKDLRKAGVLCPGSFLRVNILEDHPLTLGMKGSAGLFYRGGPIFETRIPQFDMDRRVIAKFPEDDILLSGYCEKEEKLGNRTVMTWLKKGKGQLVLFGFQPQFRASTPVTYKLLFNSILLPPIK